MIKKLLPIALCPLLLASPLEAASEQGRQLHDANCVRCHDSGVYTRADRRVNSMERLTKQVNRCQLNLRLGWFDDQIDDVTNYLNARYYHFD